MEMIGANTKGGTGYFDFISANNNSAGTTNKNKYFRIDSNGKLQIINSAYTTNIFDLNDSGYLTVPGGIATSQYIQFSDGSKQYTANAGSGGGGVTQIVAGTNVTISPAGGTGVVTINSSGASSDTFARTQANAAFDKANTAYSAATTAQGTADSAASTATAAYNTYDLASIYTPNNSTTVSATGRSDTFNLVGESGIYVYSNATTKTVTFAGGIQSLPGANGMTVDYGYVSEAIFYNIDYGTL